ncbi:MAG TPA: hypothetical protein VGX03_26575 [Candidatus Binatia bacterium]|nr:hypothetical protein [Candidatus Binatia bacterium]
MRCEVRRCLSLLVVLYTGLSGIAWSAPPQEDLFFHQRLLRFVFRPVIDRYPPEEHRQDLGLRNFFTEGWTAGWAEPEEGPDDAPRFRLLRMQRAFWEREVRLTYNHTFGAEDGEVDEQEGEFELELPLSRRFLIEFEGGFVGLKPDGGSWKRRGGDLKIIPEVMLMETHSLSFSSGLIVRTPTGSATVGEERTSLTPYLALWRDLGHRIGLHTYLGAEFPVHGFGPGAPDAVVQYGIAPAITVTPKGTPYRGNWTFFVETNGETDCGSTDDRTTVTLLPGARWLVLKDVWVAAGYEFPVTNADALDGRAWVSFYFDF